MVVIHPSLFKNTDTRSEDAFWDERIEGLLTWRKAAKDAILAADAFFMVFSIFWVLLNHIVENLRLKELLKIILNYLKF